MEWTERGRGRMGHTSGVVGTAGCAAKMTTAVLRTEDGEIVAAEEDDRGI
jgi:hypothetical protein